MPEPLNNMFSRPLLDSFAGEVQAVWPAFPAEKFFAFVFDGQWESRELKQRVRHISHGLRAACRSY